MHLSWRLKIIVINVHQNICPNKGGKITIKRCLKKWGKNQFWFTHKEMQMNLVTDAIKFCHMFFKAALK